MVLLKLKGFPVVQINHLPLEGREPGEYLLFELISIKFLVNEW